MQLTRERIITAAVELIEREGVDVGDGPGDVTGATGASWAEAVRAQARAFRQIARAYPR